MDLCPRCREPLAEPPEPFCQRCGAAVEGASDATATGPDPLPSGDAPPVPAPEPVETPPPGIPWDDRARLGFATALVDTTVQVLRAPSDFYRRMRPTGGVGAALAYAVIVAYVGFVATLLYDWIFQAVMGTQPPVLPGMGPEFERAFALMQGGGGRILQLVLAPFGLAAGVLIGAGLNHLTLMLLSGANRGFEATFRVSAFANAVNVISLLPLCGQLVAAVWLVVVTIIGLSVVHGISWRKATAAVLLPFVLFCCCCAGGILLLASILGMAAR
jgi:hypothetical protein